MNTFFAKNRIFLSFALAFCILAALSAAVLFSAPSAYAEDDVPAAVSPDIAADKTPSSVIAIASDLHYDPQYAYFGDFNPFIDYNPEIVAALLHDALEQGVDALIICGDITNAARPYQHESLSALFAEAAQKGLKIFVLNGNHDIGQTTTDEFAELYYEFGRSTAFSRDENSLSYSVILPDQFILFLDTGGYGDDDPGGVIHAPVISWAETQLEYAQSIGLPVLAVGHHPLLTRQGSEFDGGNEMLGLFAKYGVNMYICGHTHGRNVARLGELTELVVEQACSYPCSYALLYRYGDDKLMFTPRTIDVSCWAESEGIEDSRFTGFAAFSESTFMNTCFRMTENLIGSKDIPDSEIAPAAQFFYDFRVNTANGTLYWHTSEMFEHEGFNSFLRIAQDSVYYRWIVSALQSASPYTAGFYVNGGDIFAVLSDVE